MYEETVLERPIACTVKVKMFALYYFMRFCAKFGAKIKTYMYILCMCASTEQKSKIAGTKQANFGQIC